MITQTAEYALRAMACLADSADEPQTTESLAQRSRTPFGYLVKIMSVLSRRGLVVSRRGRHGGFVLARPASAISMFDVITATMADRMTAVQGPDLDADCPIARHLAIGCERGRAHWRRVTLARLVARRPSAPLRP